MNPHASEAFAMHPVACIVAALTLAASTAASATTIHVDADARAGGDGGSWASAFDDLEDALVLAAQLGAAEVWIAEGVYLPSVESTPGDPRSRRFAMPSGVSLLGGFAGTESSPRERIPGLHPTWLSGDFAGDDTPDGAGLGENAYHVVVAASLAAPTVLDGVNIRGGAATGATEATRRGGALLATNSTLALIGCRIESNRATLGGGGLRFEQCQTTLAACVCTANTCTTNTGAGGAVSVAGGSFAASSCVFTGNSVLAGTSGGEGGAVAVDGGSAIIESCAFEGNVAVRGALYLLNTTWTIVGCQFVGNTMTFGGSGGGVRAIGGGGSIADCIFQGNGTGGRFGGAVAITAAAPPAPPPSVAIESCTLVDNVASDVGGAIWVQSLASLAVGDCLITGNSSGLEGGGLGTAQSQAMAVSLERCVLDGNVSLDGGGASFAVGCIAAISECDIVGNIADDDGGGLITTSSTGQPTTVTLDRCTIRGNIAFGDGGGARLEAASATLRDCALLGSTALLGAGGGLHTLSATTTVERCTIAGNDAVEGGGVRAQSGTCSVIGSIIAGNSAAMASGAAAELSVVAPASATLSWSCLPGLPPGTPGLGNTAQQPAFIDLAGPDRVAGTDDDVPQLAPGSPCVNRGAPGIIATPAEDVTGASRVQQCRVDMGAYESPWLPAVADDCNANGALDECDLVAGLDGDCDADGVLDGCELAAGVADCDVDGVPDPCQLASGGFDCDGDGAIDSCAIASGQVPDCDGNGLVDACEIIPVPVEAASPNLGPFGTGQPQTWTFAAPPKPVTDVVLTLQCKADIGASNEFVTVTLNGAPLGNLFVNGDVDCAVPFSQASLTISAAAFLTATAGGDAIVGMTASSAVAANGCSGASFVKAILGYGTVALNDLDEDGVLDVCEKGDLDGDNLVGPADLGLLLAAWGPCLRLPVGQGAGAGASCPADLDGDGVVDGGDLGILLGLWTRPGATP